MLTNVGCRLSGPAAITFALVRRLPEAPREIAELGFCPMPGGVALGNAEGPTGQNFSAGNFRRHVSFAGRPRPWEEPPQPGWNIHIFIIHDDVVFLLLNMEDCTRRPGEAVRELP